MLKKEEEKGIKNMYRIGAFICNYNKAEFVVKCVKKIIEQTYKEIDIFVVDNASEDDSVQRLEKEYGEKITLLRNKENIGGSGGFGRAIVSALELGYKYFMLVDNDAFLDKNAVECLYDYMEEHSDVGICGAQSLYLQQPDKIQDLGGRLDMVNYNWGGVSGGKPELLGNVALECDYVASCAVMARADAVRRFGGFPEENFIYWDDIEWCTKCWRAGYKVVVNSSAKVYHDMSGANVRNMFLRYYANRNRYRFFLKYLPESKLEDFYQYITKEFFLQNYGAMWKGKYGTVLTAWNAFDDFVHGVTGKAEEEKIIAYTEGFDRLGERVAGATSVVIYMPSHTVADYRCLDQMLRYMTRQRSGLKINVLFQLSDSVIQNYDLVVQLCEHVTKVQENILPVVYVDSWRNAILDDEDFWYFTHFEDALANFREMYRQVFDKQKHELRRN